MNYFKNRKFKKELSDKIAEIQHEERIKEHEERIKEHEQKVEQFKQENNITMTEEEYQEIFNNIIHSHGQFPFINLEGNKIEEPTEEQLRQYIILDKHLHKLPAGRFIYILQNNRS